MARVLKSQGRRGEVAAELHTEFPERFVQGRRFFVLGRDGRRRELELEEHWLHKQQVVLKFRGIESISEAEELAGLEIQIPASERYALEGDAKYVSDLEGCTVVDVAHGATDIGIVREVRQGAGEAPLLVLEQGQRELLLPLAAEYVKKFDVAGKRIEMVLPEGLLELDAPLTEEEKQRQAQGK